MNRREAKGVVKHAALVAAFAEGAPIEFKDQHGNWCHIDEPAFGVNLEYRVKPEPRRLWRVESANGNVWSSNLSTKESANKVLEHAQRTHTNSDFAAQLRVVEYVEVVK